jgi:hypothetical protein
MKVNTLQCTDISEHLLFCQAHVEVMYLLTSATRMKHSRCIFSLCCLYAEPQRLLAAKVEGILQLQEEFDICGGLCC